MVHKLKVSDRKPKIWVISYKGLSHLFHSIIPSYEAVAEIQTVDKIFDEAVGIARDLAKSGQADVFISAGANGAYMRDKTPLPVVQVKVTGFDLLRALLKARDVSEKIAIVTYQQTVTELEEIKRLLNLNIEQRFYTTVEEAKDRVRELAALGYKVIVGSSLITELAEQAGLTGIFVYCASSVREAIESAIEICRIRHIEEAKIEWLNTILRHLNEGVVAVDLEERIQSLNPAMESMLGVPAEKAIGRRLSDIAPQLSLEETLRQGTTELQQIQRVGRKTLVISRIPMKEYGVPSGAVLTFEDSTAIERADRNIRTQNRKRSFAAKYRLSDIIGDSPSLRQAKLLAKKYANTESTVIITGESGTGKELFAQGIHNASRRRDGPFVAINCAALPESLLEGELFGHEEGAFTGSRRGGKAGLFEAAHTGTIFLDEIGDMPIALQTRLLRVLQEKEVLRLGSTDAIPVNVRVIAATNRDLNENVAAGKFRGDLYYRLNILHIHVLPLRSRPEDIPPIAKHLFTDALARLGSDRPVEPISEAVLPLFTEYTWPGNVREMENIIERLAVFYCDLGELNTGFRAGLHKDLVSIVPEIFCDAFEGGDGNGDGQSLKRHSRMIELRHIQRTVSECGGNMAEAARQLGISRTTVWRRLHEHGRNEAKQSVAH